MLSHLYWISIRSRRITSLVIAFIAFTTFLHTQASEIEFPDSYIKLDGSQITVSFAPGASALSIPQQSIIKWIEKRAKAVADYYQGFPVDSLDIIINAGGGARVNGSAYAGLKPLISLRLGENLTLKKLQDDWVLVHEMVHLAFPSVYKRHHWMEEGLATYVEPIVRVRAGLMSEEEAWYWLLTGVPKGQPKRGDKGLDNTPTWGRTYWGGALFCLQADYQIRQQTNSRFNLGDALRAITKAGGTMQREEGVWPITKVLKIGDKATGTNVLMTLYEDMKDKPVKVDLTAMWKNLGVNLVAKKVVFDETAPLASMRHALLRE